MQELHEEIKMAAYELYEQREMAHGYDLDDWLQAERMVIEKNPPLPPFNKGGMGGFSKEKKPNNSKSKKKGDKK
jgi:hypothetical protein